MTVFSTGFKEKVKIIPCNVSKKGVVTERKKEVFELMLNPQVFKIDRTVSFAEDCTVGKTGSEVKFQAIEPETLKMEFWIDGTGVVALDADDVTTQLEKLSKVVYQYNGENHEPNVVRVLWGTLLFQCRLTSMTADTKLFAPSGAPLRAEVTLDFKSFIPAKQEELEKDKKSPDLSRRVIFKKGDTLPLLCYEIYKDSAYYAEVADYNNLVDFRNIKPGTEIAFPPLR